MRELEGGVSVAVTVGGNVMRFFCINATIHTRQEIQCLPHAGFLFVSLLLSVHLQRFNGPLYVDYFIFLYEV